MSYSVYSIRDISVGVFDGPHATPELHEEGVAVFLGITNLTESGMIELSGARYVSESDYPKWTKRVIPQADDIVFTYEATLNRYAIIPPEFSCCLGRRTALIRPDKNKINHRFLYYYFFTPEWRTQIQANVLTGATVDRIPLTTFPDFSLRVPSIETQDRIAFILSAYDDLIESNRRRIQLLEESARLLYREWFVKLRFPGHATVPVTNGVPEGWELKPVSEMIDANPRTPFPKDVIRPFVGMEALSEDSMVINASDTRPITGGAKFRNGDTLLARITPCLENGKTGFVQFLEDDEATASGSTEFIVLRSRTVNPYWIYCLARSDSFREHAINSMAGSDGRQRVNTKCFDQYVTLQPPSDLLQGFADKVRDIFEQVQSITEHTRTLKQARDMLLPKLMSGALDVSHIAVPKEAEA